MRRILAASFLSFLFAFGLTGCGLSSEDFLGSSGPAIVTASDSSISCTGAQIDVEKSLVRSGENIDSSVVLTEENGGTSTLLSVRSLGYSMVGVIVHAEGGDRALEVHAYANENVDVELGADVESVTICLGVYDTNI